MAGTWRLAVRVKPGASRPRVGGRYAGARGDALVVAVRERAVDQAATKAAMAAVARALGLRPRQVTLASGAASRDKLFELPDEPAIRDAVARLLDDET